MIKTKAIQKKDISIRNLEKNTVSWLEFKKRQMNDPVILSGKLQQLIYSVKKSNFELGEDIHDISIESKEKTTDC